MNRKTLVHLPISNEGRKVKIPTRLPVIFLAGPIRNAPKWQEKAIDILVSKNEEIFVASPTRKVRIDQTVLLEKDNTTYEVFPRQRAWEQHYLYAGGAKGCVVFWLPKEAEIKEVEDKVYAHITMFELGQWMIRKKMDPAINLVIGTDGEFPEWSTIEFELQTEVPTVPLCYSLEETIETALKLSLNQK